MRISKTVPFFAILESALINSLPQTSFESEDTFSVSTNSNPDISQAANTNAYSPGEHNLIAAISPVDVDFDSAPDQLDLNGNEPTTAANAGDAGALCQNKNDQAHGAHSDGQIDTDDCPSGFEPQKPTTKPMTPKEQTLVTQQIKSMFMLPGGSNENFDLKKMCAIINNLIF